MNIIINYSTALNNKQAPPNYELNIKIEDDFIIDVIKDDRIR